MKRLVVLVMVVGIFLVACAQGAPVPTPTSTPTPAPTPTPPPPTPMSRYDRRFAECWDSQVTPSLERIQDDLRGLQYAQSREDWMEIWNWTGRLSADAQAIREAFRDECPIPDNPRWQEGRLLMMEAVEEFQWGAWVIELDKDKLNSGISRINSGVELVDQALALMKEE